MHYHIHSSNAKTQNREKEVEDTPFSFKKKKKETRHCIHHAIYPSFGLDLAVELFLSKRNSEGIHL